MLREQALLEERRGADGERKTVTALCAELLTSGLPADTRYGGANVLETLLRALTDAVHRYDGYVAQSSDDGLLALFGAPITQEFHAQRALYAALRMQEDIRKQAATLRFELGINVEARMGLHTGEVVLRAIRKDDLRADYTPIEHSTGFAVAMTSAAVPGSVIVTDATQKLTDGYFDFRPLGPSRVRRATEALRIHQLIGIGPFQTKLEMAARRGLTRFVGRDTEMAFLRKAFSKAKSGRGQVVGVIGEPGVGK